MSPEEKNVIGGIFERLKTAATAQRDPEAEKFIADQIKLQPYAPYVMAQAVYAQEQALTGQQQQIEQLQAQIQQLEAYVQQVQQTQQQQSGGFLGGLFGGGAKPAVPPMPMQNRAPFQRGPMGGPQGGPPPGPWGGQQAPAAGPWGGQQMQQPQQRGGMGFLGTAASAAVGVAGGIMAANALSSMFSGNQAGGAQAAAAPAAAPAPAIDQQAAGSDTGYGPETASYDDGGDFGGGDDWA